MRLHFLGKGGSDGNGCPSLYVTDQDTYLVQGWETNTAGTVEIPHLLTGFAEPDTFIGAELTDTGRGTFRVTGRPISDTDTARPGHRRDGHRGAEAREDVLRWNIGPVTIGMRCSASADTTHSIWKPGTRTVKSMSPSDYRNS